MRPDRITKLYDNLTNKERAALWYRYTIDNNEVELARIRATVPRKTYEGVDEEFKGWRLSFYVMANLWAIEYWKTFSRHLAATGVFLYYGERGEFEQERIWNQIFTYCETRLLALDRALEAICEKHGLDVECVRWLAETVPFVPRRGDTAPDAGYQAEVEANLSAVLNR